MVVAAGRGARAGGEVPKQYRPIAGVPMVIRALRPFTSHPAVAQVVLVLPPADAEHPPGFIQEIAGGPLVLVAGGAERRDSVAAGLAALAPECAVVLVHDAARPFVPRDVIDAVIAAARQGEGAVPAVPLSDTVKETTAGDDTRVERTIPRDRLWRVQTPQGFPRQMISRAHARAAEAAPAPDDAALVEATGGAVRLVPGSAVNLKITTRDDFVLAELLAASLP